MKRTKPRWLYLYVAPDGRARELLTYSVSKREAAERIAWLLQIDAEHVLLRIQRTSRLGKAA